MLSETYLISSKRRYGWSRVCRVWRIPRSTVYAWRQRQRVSGQMVNRRGRRPWLNNEDLMAAMRTVFTRATSASFHGEGYRKVWARLRHQGIRADKDRIRRLMRQHDLLAPCEAGPPPAPVCMMAQLSRLRQI